MQVWDYTVVDCKDGTLNQHNGFDCGVFAFMFADFLGACCPLPSKVAQSTHDTERRSVALSVYNLNLPSWD